MNSYHALTVVGYDDAKNAFRIENSWGTSWGGQGYIWVDYNFFFSVNFDNVKKIGKTLRELYNENSELGSD